jgi:hypothetical protein
MPRRAIHPGEHVAEELRELGMGAALTPRSGLAIGLADFERSIVRWRLTLRLCSRS